MLRLNKTLLSIIVVFIIVHESAAASADLEAFSKGLNAGFARIKENVGFVDDGRVFAEKVIDSKWYLKGNTSLSKAGEQLIVYLQDSDELYKQLEFPDWLKATEELLKVDEWLSGRVGWGNLVIKVAICNKVINRVMQNLEARENLSSEEFSSMLKVLEQLRWRVPSEKVMYFIAYRYHVGEEPFKVKALSYTEQDVELFRNKQISPLALMAKHYSRFKLMSDEEIIALFNTWAEEESRLVLSIADYRDLYANPIPYLLALKSRYREHLWDLYFNVLIRSQEGGNEINWMKLTEKDVLSHMQKVPAGGYPWMTRIAYDFYTERSKHARTYYLEYIKEDGGLRNLRRSYEGRLEREAYVNQMKKKPVERRSSIKFSSIVVHQMP